MSGLKIKSVVVEKPYIWYSACTPFDRLRGRALYELKFNEEVKPL
jgi:hypothetical protein